MGFGDKLKDIRKQAQEAVTEHREQIHDAVDAVGVAANAKTRGKHTQRIAKFGEKASNALDKFAEHGEGASDAAATAAPAQDAAQAPEPTVAAGEPEAPTSPPSAAPSPPAANPDLAAWAAGDDGAG